MPVQPMMVSNGVKRVDSSASVACTMSPAKVEIPRLLNSEVRACLGASMLEVEVGRRTTVMVFERR